jgi:hypothetical protein
MAPIVRQNRARLLDEHADKGHGSVSRSPERATLGSGSHSLSPFAVTFTGYLARFTFMPSSSGSSGSSTFTTQWPQDVEAYRSHNRQGGDAKHLTPTTYFLSVGYVV